MLTVVTAPFHNEFMPILAAVESTELTEQELVERFRETGQDRYFGSLYVLARRAVYSRCLAILRDGESAEDLTHEAFLRAYDQFTSLEGTNFSGWVYRIATNLSLNRLRDELNRKRILESQAQSTLRDKEENPVPEEDVNQARRVMETLKKEHRTVLTLKYLEGCSYKEIEKKTGYSTEQVRSYLQNARRNFRKRWTKLAGATGSPQ